jgi:hypothetical protein
MLMVMNIKKKDLRKIIRQIENLFNPKFPEAKKQEILEATIFDPKFPEEKKQYMLDEVLKRENGKKLLEGGLTNKVVGYLNEEFKKHEGKQLNLDDKKLIAQGLKDIISPFKTLLDKASDDKNRKGLLYEMYLRNQHPEQKKLLFKKYLNKDPDQQYKFLKDFDKTTPNFELFEKALGTNEKEMLRRFKSLNKSFGLEDESLKLVHDLDIDKLVSRTARESEDLKQGFIGKIKKFCRSVLDSITIFTSKEKEILKAFKDNVEIKKGSVSNNLTKVDLVRSKNNVIINKLIKQ